MSELCTIESEGRETMRFSKKCLMCGKDYDSKTTMNVINASVDDVDKVCFDAENGVLYVHGESEI